MKHCDFLFPKRGIMNRLPYFLNHRSMNSCVKYLANNLSHFRGDFGA